MPNRERRGEVSKPARVVAPTKVNLGTGTLTDRAPGSLADDDIELVILHRRVEDLLDRRAHAMDLVDEQHVPRVEVGQDAGEVARFLEHRSGRRPHGDA